MMRQYELVDRVRRYNPQADEVLLNRAYVYAMQAHGAQVRASGDPYFSHPLEVAAILTDLHLDDATIIAAVLHDVIEDTEATREEIDRLFGREIGALVEGLTKLKRLDLVSKRAVQAENFRKLLLAIAADVRVLLVKLADRLHNMRTLHFVPPEKRARIAEETLDIYAPLAGRMGMQRMREELEDLAFRHLMPDAHATIEARLDDVGRNNKLRIVAIRGRDRRPRSPPEGIVADVEGRQKQPYSVWRKMERKQITFEQMSDIFGFRIVVRTLPECYRAIGVVHTRWPTVPGRFKDYISTPKPQRLSLDPYDRRRSGTPARRAAGAYDGDARHRLPRHRRPCSLQGGPGVRRHRHAQREQGVCLAAPHDRVARRRVVARRIPGAHQARAVSRPGVLLHPQRAAHRAPARRDGDRLRLCRPTTDVGNQASAAKINGRSAPLLTELGNGDEVEIARQEGQVPPAVWETLVVTGKARAAIRRATRDAMRAQYAGLGRQIVARAFERAGRGLVDERMKAVLPRFARSSIDDVFARRRPRRDVLRRRAQGGLSRGRRRAPFRLRRSAPATPAGSAPARTPTCCSTCRAPARRSTGR